jgi:hypothetical protein
MTRRSTLWRVVAGVYVFINVAGFMWAMFSENDPNHAMLHVGLLIAGYVAWRAPWRRQQEAPAPQLDERRIEYLQQSVDAIALEVERIGEKQRFTDKLRVERGETPLKKDER